MKLRHCIFEIQEFEFIEILKKKKTKKKKITKKQTKKH